MKRKYILYDLVREVVLDFKYMTEELAATLNGELSRFGSWCEWKKEDTDDAILVSLDMNHKVAL